MGPGDEITLNAQDPTKESRRNLKHLITVTSRLTSIGERPSGHARRGLLPEDPLLLVNEVLVASSLCGFEPSWIFYMYSLQLCTISMHLM